MIVTFTKLLVIRIVASSRSLLLSKREIRLSDGFFSSSITLKSLGDKEKNAISEAEAKAEKSNKTAATTMAMTAAVDGC